MIELVEEFADEAGGPMALGEFLEILGWSVPSNSPHLSDIVLAPLVFSARVRGLPYQDRRPSRVAELDDSVFVSAAELLDSLAADAAARTGGPVSVAVLPALLGSLLNSMEVTFADASGREVELDVRIPKSRAKPKVGDVVAIPARDGRNHGAVVVARNPFGTALGLFVGTFVTVSADGLRAAEPDPFPVYTDEEMIVTGAWRIVGNDVALAGRFPARPEIYHDPRHSFFGFDYGEFGAAETSEGDLRLIGRDEAAAVGLLDGTYAQNQPAEHLQSWLDGRLPS